MLGIAECGAALRNCNLLHRESSRLVLCQRVWLGAEVGAELLEKEGDSAEQRLQLAEWRGLNRVLAWFREGAGACKQAELAFSPTLNKDHRAQVKVTLSGYKHCPVSLHMGQELLGVLAGQLEPCLQGDTLLWSENIATTQ